MGALVVVAAFGAEAATGQALIETAGTSTSSHRAIDFLHMAVAHAPTG